MPTVYEHCNIQTRDEIERVRKLIVATYASEVDVALLGIIERIIDRLDWMDELKNN